MDIVKISPESLEIANTYLSTGSINETAAILGLPASEVTSYLDRREVKSYVDQVFLDQGYRNRGKLFALMEEIIESKLQEARDTELYTSKDLLEVITQYHKMRMDEVKLARPPEQNAKTQINVQNNFADEYGGGKYGELLRKLHAGSE